MARETKADPSETANPASDDDLTIGDRLRSARMERGVTLRELARRVSLSPSLLSQLENNRTNANGERIEQIALALDIDPAIFAAVTDDAASNMPADWRSYTPIPLDPVLSAALASILKSGYHGSFVREIASLSGLSVPGIYHYYPSKQHMLVALLDITMDDLLWRSVAARDEGSTPVKRFELLIECLALYHTYRQDLAFVGASEMRSLEPENRRRIAALRTAQQHMVDVEVDAAVASGDFANSRPKEASRAIVTMCTGLAQWFQPDGPNTPEDIAEMYVTFALGVMHSNGSRS